jgi:membrane associated rhomboid family serine protease
MFPVGDTEVRGAGPGVVTIGLMVLNVLVFLYEAMLSQQALEQFIYNFGMIPAQIMQGEGLGTLLTSMFLHGGWLHLISNMLFLWVFGDNIEAILGKIGYPVFYLAGGLAASAAHILLSSDSTIPSVGASGAIAAILGAYIVMFPNSQVNLLVLGRGAGMTRVSALFFLGIWAVMQLFSGLASLGVETAQTGGVAFWAHIGGFVFGLVVGFLFKGMAANRLDFGRGQTLSRTRF